MRSPKLSLPCLGGRLSFTLTLEPMILLFNLGASLGSGAQQTTNLMHRYACERVLGHDYDTCARLNEAEDVQIPVQKIINMSVSPIST